MFDSEEEATFSAVKIREKLRAASERRRERKKETKRADMLPVCANREEVIGTGGGRKQKVERRKSHEFIKRREWVRAKQIMK